MTNFKTPNETVDSQELPPNAPTTAELYRVVEGNETSPALKVIPPLIYVDFLPTRGAYSITNRGVHAHYTPKTLLTALDGFVICKPEVEKRLREIEKSIRDLNAEMAKYSGQQANELFYRQSRELAANMTGSKIPEQIALGTREQIHHQFRMKRNAIEISVLPLRDEARALAAPIIRAAKNIVWHHMAALEHNERQMAEEYDVTFVPSYHWRALAAAMVTISPDRVNQEIYPSSMLSGFLTF